MIMPTFSAPFSTASSSADQAETQANFAFIWEIAATRPWLMQVTLIYTNQKPNFWARGSLCLPRRLRGRPTAAWIRRFRRHSKNIPKADWHSRQLCLRSPLVTRETARDGEND